MAMPVAAVGALALFTRRGRINCIGAIISFSASTRIGIVIRINDNIATRTMTMMTSMMVGATMIMAMPKICDGDDDDPCDEERYDGYEGYAGFDEAYDDGGNGYDDYDDDEYDDDSQSVVGCMDRLVKWCMTSWLISRIMTIRNNGVI